MANYGDYSKLLVIFAIICVKFYHVYNSINLVYCFAFPLLQILLIFVFIVIIGICVIDFSWNGWYKMSRWMADIRRALTDLEAQQLWWRRIPTETSGCSVRESNQMLLGSAHKEKNNRHNSKMIEIIYPEIRNSE
jgi:maltodextrin utilization protein YvdJ